MWHQMPQSTSILTSPFPLKTIEIELGQMHEQFNSKSRERGGKGGQWTFLVYSLLKMS